MNKILEAVQLRLRFDDTGEFKKALLELLDRAELRTACKKKDNDEGTARIADPRYREDRSY